MRRRGAGFTVCGQNYGPLCGFRECFDGSKEADVVLKDDVHLREQKNHKEGEGRGQVTACRAAARYLFKQNQGGGRAFAPRL